MPPIWTRGTHDMKRYYWTGMTTAGALTGGDGGTMKECREASKDCLQVAVGATPPDLTNWLGTRSESTTLGNQAPQSLVGRRRRDAAT